MREHLSNPEYLHVLLNPLPIYGLAVGVLGLVVALISRSRAARVTALVIVFVCARFQRGGLSRRRSWIRAMGAITRALATNRREFRETI
jgi:hypothetical protein